MRAIRYAEYGGIDVMQEDEVDVPEIAPHEVLIRVSAASINPFDWKLRNGRLREHYDPDFPVIPGRDGCGEIVAIGAGVPADEQGLTEGRRVAFISSRLFAGSLAGFVAVRASGSVVPLADSISDDAGAALPLAGLSAWNALVETGQVRSGMRVLIHGGSGGVGSIAIQLAQHFGAEVWATCRRAKAGIVESLGATAIPYDETDFTTAVSDCDLVIDTVGGEVHAGSYRALREGGCLVYLLAQPFEDHAAEYGVTLRQAVVLGRPENLREVVALAAAGEIEAVVGQVLPMAEFERAFRMSEAGEATGKIVVRVPAED